MERTAHVVDGLLHVAILFTVLTLFYKLYISKVSTKAFQSEFSRLINTNLGSNSSLKKVMSSAVGRHVARSKSYAALEQNFAVEDAGVAQNNKWLFRAAFTGCAGLVGMIACLVWASSEHVPLGALLASNAATFACVGVVEALLFIEVVSKVVPAPPSVLIDSAIQSAKATMDT